MGATEEKAKEKFWQRAIAERRDSGLSVAEYCRREGLSDKTYYYWQRRLQPRGSARKVPPETQTVEPVFLPVRLQALGEDDAKTAAARIEVLLACGQVVSVPLTRENFAMVVDVLEGRAC